MGSIVAMNGLAFTLVLAYFTASGINAKAPEHGRRVVCFMASWGIYLKGAGRFDIADAEPALPMCTHLVYLFASLDGPTFQIKSSTENRDYELNGYSTTIALKNKFPHIKVMIAIGGWVDGSINYSMMARDAGNRVKFVASVVEFLKKNNFDGLDLNWQFPGDRGGIADDKQNFVTLIKELRTAFDKLGLILSVSVSSFPWRMDLGINEKEVAENAHFVNVLSYEYHASWDTRVGPSTPLYAPDNFSINNTVTRYLGNGAPAYKLNLGLSSYGTTFTLLNPNSAETIIGKATTGPGFKGSYNDVDGFMAYNELCWEMDAGGWSEVWDDVSQTPFAVSQARVVSYDNARSFDLKVQYAMEKQLGGVIFYGLEKDDFKNACKSSKGSYPNLRSIHMALMKYSTFDDLMLLLKQQNSKYFWKGLQAL